MRSHQIISVKPTPLNLVFAISLSLKITFYTFLERKNVSVNDKLGLKNDIESMSDKIIEKKLSDEQTEPFNVIYRIQKG